LKLICAFKNDNEQMAIYLIKILSNILKQKNESINKFNEMFQNIFSKETFNKNWLNLIETILDLSNENNFIQLLINDNNNNNMLMLVNESRDSLLLRHETTQRLLNYKWKYIPRLIYYSNLLMYLFFLISYSLMGTNKEWTQTTRIFSSILLAYLILIQLMHLKSISNLFEFIIQIICGIQLIRIENNELYSITILFSYFILIKRLNNCNGFGAFINVLINITKKSIPLFMLTFICLIGFLFAFKNRSKLNEMPMSHFNVTYSESLVKLLNMFLGDLETNEMGINELGINFLLYAFFIFLMPILFINIFTGISIDEIQKIIENSEAENISYRIEYVDKIESFRKIIIINKFMNLLYYLLQTIIRHRLELKMKINSKKIKNTKIIDGFKSKEERLIRDRLNNITNDLNQIKYLLQNKLDNVDKKMATSNNSMY
jgi:hypothetical protein